jgi:ubiquinone/menaquinone biosynthesis C-methylase UbiE
MIEVAQIHGSLWGAGTSDYAEIVEPMFRPVYERVFDEVGVGRTTRLLDVGCGPGLAAQIAARRGAYVAGLDPADASLVIARERTPTGDFRSGTMEDLPWPGAVFDVATFFNSLAYSADPPAALREARRTTRHQGRVAIVDWGRKEECDTMATVTAVNKVVLPPSGPYSELRPASVATETLLRQTGWSILASSEVDCTFQFPDLQTAIRGYTAVGPIVAVVQQVGADRVWQAIAESLRPFRTGAGGYLQRNRFRYVIGVA